MNEKVTSSLEERRATHKFCPFSQCQQIFKVESCVCLTCKGHERPIEWNFVHTKVYKVQFEQKLYSTEHLKRLSMINPGILCEQKFCHSVIYLYWYKYTRKKEGGYYGTVAPHTHIVYTHSSHDGENTMG